MGVYGDFLVIFMVAFHGDLDGDFMVILCWLFMACNGYVTLW